MATAIFELDGMTKAVARIKSETVYATLGNEIDKPLTFTTNASRLETTNSKANNNVLYAIVGANTFCSNLVNIYHSGSGNIIGYFTVQGGNVGANDFIYHIRQITLSFV